VCRLFLDMQGKDGTRVAKLAANQQGVVAAWQLVKLGFSRGWIEHQVRLGRLHRVFRGVYSVGHANVTAQGRAMAGVLSCGPGAALSHWSAARLWGLLQTNHAVIEVVLSSNRDGPKGVRVHRDRRLDRNDITRRDGIPITTVPRTLLDLAAVAEPRQLRRAVNETVRQGRLSGRVVADLCAQHEHKKGIKAFRAVTAALHPQTRRTRSDLEVDFLRLCRKYQLPQPDVNIEIEGYEVDIHFPGTKLIVELDGYEFHRTRTEFDSDRRRDAHLKVKGYEVLRVSDEWLNSDARGVAMTIRALL
jgi:very-short-patch-repair endonuclease